MASAVWPALEATGISKSFGPHVVLRNVELRVPQGSFLALLGPNGAGKTTLLKILAGLARPSGGTVRLLGGKPGRPEPAMRARIGLVSHEAQLYRDLSAEENLRFFGTLYGLPALDARIEEVLAGVELLERRGDPVRTLSHGMTQRLSIARSLLHDPEVLLLDEPTSGLDDRAVGLFVDLLASLHDGSRTLVMTTHQIDVGLRAADRMAVLTEGRISLEEDAPGGDADGFKARYAALVGSRR
ncbi:MAG: ABC transporter ATP-binding protein [Deltaproteobacteria bacterium]|nr:ABC transporter ATP-binding protein [Deltaproteobacteria bacterium]